MIGRDVEAWPTILISSWIIGSGTLEPSLTLASRFVPKPTLCGTLDAFPDLDDWALTAESAD
jgi:hypothetical protein